MLYLFIFDDQEIDSPRPSTSHYACCLRLQLQDLQRLHLLCLQRRLLPAERCLHLLLQSLYFLLFRVKLQHLRSGLLPQQRRMLLLHVRLRKLRER